MSALAKSYENRQQYYHSAETSVVYYSSREYYADPYDLLFEVKRHRCSLAVLLSLYTNMATTRLHTTSVHFSVIINHYGQLTQLFNMSVTNLGLHNVSCHLIVVAASDQCSTRMR